MSDTIADMLYSALQSFNSRVKLCVCVDTFVQQVADCWKPSTETSVLMRTSSASDGVYCSVDQQEC